MPFQSKLSLAKSPFAKGQWEATVNGGAMFSPFISTANRHTLNYSMFAVQAGQMLTEPESHWGMRGNYELAGEIFGGNIFQGTGDYLAGSTLWLRYNWLPEGWRMIPYAQAGLGLVCTDLDRDLLGEDLNFNLQLGFGVRYLISDHCSLNLEYRFQHISDAGITRKNIGVNADGVMAGLSYFF